LGEEDAVGLVAGDEGVGVTAGSGTANGAGIDGVGSGCGGRVGNKEAGFARVEVEDVDAVGSGVDHLLPVGGVGVDVEVEAAGVGLVAEAPDAVTGVLVDPGFRDVRTAGEGCEYS
jgi:hypothetical protein